MADPGRTTARLVGRLVALVVALGLTLMHTGVGSAACAGTGAMPGMTGASTAHRPAPHPTPSDQHPAAGHGSTCVSTPATDHPTTTEAGPAVVGLLLQALPAAAPTTLATTGGSSAREPPAPDLVAELCVQRV